MLFYLLVLTTLCVYNSVSMQFTITGRNLNYSNVYCNALIIIIVTFFHNWLLLVRFFVNMSNCNENRATGSLERFLSIYDMKSRIHTYEMGKSCFKNDDLKFKKKDFFKYESKQYTIYTGRMSLKEAV